MSNNAKKGAESKFYPNSSLSLEKYLLVTKMRNDNLGASTILSQKTIDRLNSIQPLYKQAREQVAARKVALSSINRQREKARTDTLLHVSHFLQVFNMGIKRGKYLFADRVLFGMDAYSETLPKLHSDSHIKAIAEKISGGEAKRIADGKPPMSNPSGAEVEAQYNLFRSLHQQWAAADFALADAQKALRDLHKEARAVVKRVWREVEIYYHDGDRERMRKWAREWGVHYARKGGQKIVSGTMTDAATGLPLGGVKMKFEKGNNKTYTDQHGRFTLKTNLLHSQKLTAILPGYDPAEIMVELKEGEENFCEGKMKKHDL